MLDDEVDSILNVLQERDVLVLDRGFRDVIDDVESRGVATFMPQCLAKGQKQFNTLEANKSRQVNYNIKHVNK